MFTLHKTTASGRLGTLQTPHGEIQTPFFMPVGTAGAMKGITHQDLYDLGAQILLCNTYHLHLQPGEDIVAGAGGLHSFIDWRKPILTDSGGFQVFSLRDTSKITDDGVHFKSHINGDKLFLDPETAMRIQHKLGADMIMCFDECPPSTASRESIIKAVDRTIRWAAECKKWHDRLKGERLKRTEKMKKTQRNAAKVSTSFQSFDSLESFQSLNESSTSFPLLFGIVQGGLEPDLRKKCAEELIAIGFDGYAIGGLAVGESQEEMYDVVDMVAPLLPEDRLRYLMGVGVREQLEICVSKGIDMFDCVLPMRIARHGTVLLTDGSDIRITNQKYKTMHEPIDLDSPSVFSRTHLKSYLHHLMRANERLGETIASLQNIGVTLKTMKDLRSKIESE